MALPNPSDPISALPNPSDVYYGGFYGAHSVDAYNFVWTSTGLSVVRFLSFCLPWLAPKPSNKVLKALCHITPAKPTLPKELTQRIESFVFASARPSLRSRLPCLTPRPSSHPLPLWRGSFSIVREWVMQHTNATYAPSPLKYTWDTWSSSANSNTYIVDYISGTTNYYVGNNGQYPAPCYSVDSYTICANGRYTVVVYRSSSSPGNWPTDYSSDNRAYNLGSYWISDLTSIALDSNNQWGVAWLLNAASTSSTTSYIQIGRFKRSSNSVSLSYTTDPKILTTQSKCFRLFLDTGVSPSRYFASCSNGIVIMPAFTKSDGSNYVYLPNYNSAAWNALGVGDYTTGLIVPSTRRLYLGSSIGLAFEVDLTSISLLRVTLLSTGGLLSPFASVVMDSPASSPFGVLYWGTTDGNIARVNLRDFSVFSSASLANDAGMNLNDATVLPSMSLLIKGTSNSDPNSLFVLGGSPLDLGNTNNFRSWTVGMTDCSIYSCSTCNSNPVDLDYCGWCLTTGTCTRSTACPAIGSNSAWQQNQTCPVPVSLSPSIGSTAGGTLVIYFGTIFSTLGSYTCKWGSLGNTAATPIPGVTNAVYCFSPTSGLVANVGVALSILFTPTSGGSQRAYSDALTFTPYSCASATTCSDCQSLAARYSECGWCFRSATCTASSTCKTNAGFPSSANMPANEWQQSTCPAVSSVGSATASGSTATAVTVAIGSVPSTNISVAVSSWVYPTATTSFAVFNYQCVFSAQSGTTAGATYTSAVTSATSSTGRVVCPIPSSITTSGTATYTVSISLTGQPTRLLSSSSASGLTVFDCTQVQGCYECNSYSTCTWCTSSSASNCLVAPSATQAATCPTGYGVTTTCSKMTDYSPVQASIHQISGGLTISVTGTALTDASSNLQSCYFVSASGASFSSSMQSTTETTTICPFPSGITAGNWSFSLGSTTSRQTQSYPFYIYDCSAYTTCGSCVTGEHPMCDWCLDIDAGGPANGGANTGCADSSHTSACATSWLSTRGFCPSLSTASPNNFALSGNSTVVLRGDAMMIGENNATLVDCHFFIPAATSTGSITDLGVTTASWNTTENGLSCPVPASSNAVVAAVELVSSVYHDQLFATSTAINYITCSSFSTCDTCLSGETFCTWCGASCTDDCSVPAWEASVCPNVTSVSPDYSATGGGEPITIYGTGFLVVSSSKKRDLSSTSASTKATYVANKDAANTINGIFASVGSERRAISSTAAELDTTGAYTCDFGGITSPAEVNAEGTAITCTSPAKAVGDSILNVLFNGSIYVSTSGISYFTCSSSSSVDRCTVVCTANPHCGWCVASGSCASQTQCVTAENTENPVWQPSCTTATLNRDEYPSVGKYPVTATLSTKLPSTVVKSDLQCVFGSTSAANATSIGTTTAFDPLTNTTVTYSTITCPSPASAPTTTTFAVTYKSNALISNVELVYADCSIYKDCTRCLSIPYCGWCGTGNKCSMDVQCTGTWSRRSCPANKVAIGVGVGVGLFVLILLVLLLLFLVRRYTRKDGLVIALKEPNYFEIAWGADTTLWWKIPSDVERYEVLERHLSRQDFLLQVAIAFNCPATEQDALAKALVYVASAHHIAASMIQTCIRYEVQTCKEENTLFRNNSVASKMYKFFSRIVGIKYLFHCIARVIKELEVLGSRQISASDAAAAAQASGGTTQKSGRNGSPQGSADASLLSMNMELDQTKALGDDIDTDTNLLQLQLICQKLLNVIIKTSVRNIPADFRKIFIEIDNSVMSKFGSNDAVYKGIGGLFFLRFICPALTAPHVYGLLETPPNQVTQRQLVLITKVIQNIANMQEPGKKEEYMAALSSFIAKSIPKIVTFYDDLRAAVNLSENIENYETTVIEVPDEVKMNGLAAAANFLHTETPKLRTWTDGEACPFDDMAKSELHQMLDEVQQTYPKPPKKAAGSSGATSATSQLEGSKKKKKSKK